MSEITASSVVGLLAEPHRLAVFAAAALGARTPAEVAERAGLASKAAARAHQKLTAAGLLTAHGAVDVGVLRALAKATAGPPANEDHGYADPSSERTLRAFLRDGAVTALPAQQGRRHRRLGGRARRLMRRHSSTRNPPLNN